MWQELAADGAFDPQYRRALEQGDWETLKQGQRDSRITFWKETGYMRRDVRARLREDVRTEFASEWKEYAAVKEKREKEARAYDQEARRALRHYRRHGRLHGVKAVSEIKLRQKTYHANQREALWQMRSAIALRQKERLEGLTEPALAKLSADRTEAYNQFLADQRQQKRDLREKRLADGNLVAPSILTSDQLTAYVDYARAVTSRVSKGEHEKPQRETGPIGAAANPPDPELSAEEKRKIRLAWNLQTPPTGQPRTRGGGRKR
jgi:murein L,D-transpeptidase YcbB/YkuD